MLCLRDALDLVRYTFEELVHRCWLMADGRLESDVGGAACSGGTLS